MFKKLKNPYIKFSVVFGALMLLVIALALPALVVRSLGDEVIVDATAYRSFTQSGGGTINYTLDIQNVPLENISETIIDLIEEEVIQFRITATQGFYLHLRLNQNNRIESTYLSTSKPSNNDPYIRVKEAFIERDYRQDEPEILGVQLQFENNTYYLSEQAMDNINWRDYEHNVTMTLKIWRGHIQVTDVRRR